MTVLITGGAGLIGSKLTEILLTAGETVVVYDNRCSPNILDNIRRDFNELHIVEGDVLLPGTLASVVQKYGVSDVIHLAGHLAAECSANPEAATAVNIMGTVNVLEVARNLELHRVIVASSSSVYGLESSYPDGLLPLRENAPLLLAPHSPIYSGCKLYVEKLAEHYQERFDVDVVVIRPSTVYGPGRRTGGFRWLSDFITAAALGRPTTVRYASSIVNLIYVDDAAAQFAAVLAAPKSAFVNHRFFNSGGDICTISDVVSAVRAEAPDAEIELLDEGQVLHAYSMTDELLRDVVQHRREFTPIATGIRAHIEVARERYARAGSLNSGSLGSH